MRKDISLKGFFILCPTLFLLKLWLVSAHHVMVTLTPHDDLLFIRHAQSLLSGNWLGDYNQLTLIKEPFYPIFIAVSHWLSIPLLTSQQILYALSCCAFVWAVRPIVQRTNVLLLLFIVLLLNPGSYNYPAIGRIFQLAIYSPLAVMVLSCLLGVAIRASQSPVKAVFWSVGLGVVWSLFWITRDESIFLAPSLLLMFVFLLIAIGRTSRSRFVLILLLAALPFAMMKATTLVIKKINMAKYGVPAVVEITSPEFVSAYTGLLRIKSNQELQYFPVVRDARVKAYTVSPTFREVEQYLDGPVGQGWQNLAGAGDIPAAFFIWAFRDSVAAAGYYKSGPEALGFYRKMGQEINAACDSGRLDCRPRPEGIFSSSSLVPPWRPEYNKLVLPEFFSILKKTISFDGFNAATDSARSFGPAEIMDLFSAVTGEELQPSKKRHDIFWKLEEHLNKEKTRILGQVGWFYQLVTPVLFYLACAGLLWKLASGLKNRRLGVLTVFSLSVLGGIFAIVFVMVLLTITSYSEIARVMQVGFPLVLLFILSVFLDILAGGRTPQGAAQA